MRRALVAFGVAVALVGALVVAAMVAIQSGWAERRVESELSARIDRDVDIEGLRLLARWPPQLEIASLRVPNPDWARERYLLDARGVRASLAVAPLLRGRFVVTAALDAATVGLEKRGELATWQFNTAGPSSAPKGSADTGARPPSRFALSAASLGDVRATYVDRDEDTDVAARLGGELGREGRPFHLQAEGRLRGETLNAAAQAPAVPLSGETPVQLSFKGTLGDNSAAGALSLRAAANALQTLEGRLEASGPSFAALAGVAGRELPESAPYRIAARVRHEEARWEVQDLQVALGRSDLRGAVTVESREGRLRVQANLTSDRFDLKETGIKEKVKEKLQQRYLLPRDPWPTEGWDDIDVDVALEMKEIHNARPVPLDALQARIILESSSLRVDPLTVRLAGGTVSGHLALDAAESPEHGSAVVDIRGLQLSRLAPKLQGKNAALGRINGRIELTGRGETPSSLLGHSNGRILFAAERGMASALLVEILGLDAAEAVTLLGKKRDLPLRCAVMDLPVKNGNATTNAFVIDATDTVLSVEGSAHLGKETLSLLARAEPRDASAFTLRTPADITGTFLDPKVRPRLGPLAGRAAGAVALALINPLLALLPFVDPGGDPEGGCQPQKR